MTEEQFKLAEKLRRESFEIKQELKIWAEGLRSIDQLAYLQSWNNNHATKLNTQIPHEIFDGFRVAAMNALQLRLMEITAEFAEVAA